MYLEQFVTECDLHNLNYRNSHNIQNQDIQDFMVNKTAPILTNVYITMS